MELTRRNLLATGASALALIGAGAMPAFASLAEEAVGKLTGGAETAADGIVLTAPEIAENGNTVPIEVAAPGAVAITLFADGNPVPAVATFRFGPLNPTQSASTRIRLAKTQNVIAVAEMADGSFRRAESTVKVTIGGCGG